MIKPIETIYNGYRFRSRLEARWAVFFDSAHIKYQYEWEGFDLHGEYYLPDFYLPDFDIYVEIKPFDRNIIRHVGDNNEWEQKCSLFRDITEQAIMLCYDDPAADVYKRLFAWGVNYSGGGCEDWLCVFAEKNNEIVIIVEPYKDHEVRLDNCATESTRILNVEQDCWDVNDWIYNPNGNTRLDYAKTMARQARFEHGEKPII